MNVSIRDKDADNLINELGKLNKEFEAMADKYTKQANKVQSVGQSVSPFAYVWAIGLVLFVIELIVLGNIWAINEIANFF